MSRLLVLLPFIALLLSACWVASESGEAPDPVISFEPAGDSAGTIPPTLTVEEPSPAPLFVDTLVGSEIEADVVVIGYLVIDSTGAKLCGVLLESYPPQCGPESVTVTGIDNLDVTFKESQGVRWTDSHVALWGHYFDGTLAILSGQPPTDAVTQPDTVD